MGICSQVFTLISPRALDPCWKQGRCDCTSDPPSWAVASGAPIQPVGHCSDTATTNSRAAESRSDVESLPSTRWSLPIVTGDVELFKL
jgi:hypothetical protein